MRANGKVIVQLNSVMVKILRLKIENKHFFYINNENSGMLPFTKIQENVGKLQFSTTRSSPT